MRAETLDLEQRSPSALQPRIQHVAQLVGDEVDATMVSSSAMPGKKLIQYLPDSRYW